MTMSPKVAQTIYQLGTAIPAVLGILLIWGGIDQGAANGIGQILGGLVSIFGAAAPAVAAGRVSKQRKDGTFDTVSPADQVINGAQALNDAKANAEAELERAKQGVSDALGGIPIIGGLAQQVIASVPTKLP